MKSLKCIKCGRNQKEGKFCLDCGGILTEVITEEVKFKPISTNRSTEKLKINIRSWLGRIGVQQPDITINISEGKAEVEYILKRQVYTFSSNLQDNARNNLAAVELFLHHRIIGIERGIETIEKAFSGYTQLSDPRVKQNPYEILGFKEKVNITEARKKYRELTKIHHPDVGGNLQSFNAINKAMKEIEEENK